jgi:class 3 adenylate cyclase/tetratricopeptide (TPR) repeat protein
MTFDELLAQVLDLLQRDRRLSYRALKLRFGLDDELLAALKDEIIEAKQLAVDERGVVLVWSGNGVPALPAALPVRASVAAMPAYLAEKIRTTREALAGERKQVTVLFADLKDSTELIRGLDPEVAQQLLDPALQHMMDAVHRFEGTVNQVLGDGIMALFGAPIAHEDHALRAAYAALAMQAAMRAYTEEVRRAHGLEMRIRVGLNSGEVVVRAIGNDLHMDYSAVGETTHLAARMEQMATPGTIRLTAATLRLVEGLVQVQALGPVPVKGLVEAVDVFELLGASGIRRRVQAAAARGLTRFVGRQTELTTLTETLAQASAGHGQVVALVGEAGVGKSRLVYECVHSYRTQGWLVLESASVSYGKATPYFPVIDLLKRYGHMAESDDSRAIRAKITGQVLTLDAALQALAHLPEDRDTTVRAFDLRLALGSSLFRLGEYRRNLALLSETEALAKTLDDRPRLGQVLAQMAGVYRITGDLDGAMAAGWQALDLAVESGAGALQALAAYFLGQAYWGRGDFQQAAELLHRSMAVGLESGASGTDVRLQSQAWLARVLSALGNFAEGRRHGEEALRLATQDGRGNTPIIAYAGLGHLYLSQGHLERAALVLEQGMILCRASGNRTAFLAIAADLGYALALQGRLVEGRALLEEAMSAGVSSGGLQGQAARAVWLSEVCRLAGHNAEAGQHARQALDLARQLKERGNEARALHQLGVVQTHAEPGETEEAKSHYQQALALADELGMRPLMAHCHRSLGALYIALGGSQPAPLSPAPSISTALWTWPSGCRRRRQCWRDSKTDSEQQYSLQRRTTCPHPYASRCASPVPPRCRSS